jgi:hypothetical protein
LLQHTTFLSTTTTRMSIAGRGSHKKGKYVESTQTL